MGISRESGLQREVCGEFKGLTVLSRRAVSTSRYVPLHQLIVPEDFLQTGPLHPLVVGV